MTSGLEEFLIDESEDTSDATVGLDTDVRYCACGCGEILNPTGKFKYKRGHKLNAVSQGFEPDPDRAELADGGTEERKPRRPRKVKLNKADEKDIMGQVALVFTFVGMLWGAADPVCAEPFIDNVDAICEKTLPIICKSPRVVQFMLSNGGLLDYLALGIALKPVFQTAVKHHIFHSIDSASVISIQRQSQNELYPAG